MNARNRAQKDYDRTTTKEIARLSKKALGILIEPRSVEFAKPIFALNLQE